MTLTTRGRERIQQAAQRILTDHVRLDTVTVSTAPGSIEATESVSLIYRGRGLVTRSAGTDAESSQPGARNRYTDDYSARLPVSVTGAEVGQRLTVVASADPDLTGATFAVTGVADASNTSTRRITLERHLTGARS